MRLVLAACLLATPATAWEFSSSPVCMLSQATDSADVTVTFDPRRSDPFAITLERRDAPWADAPVFAMRFDGLAPTVITTNRHSLNGPRLTVSDTGFGNVLAGMALNQMAVASLGDQLIVIPLIGAAPEVEKFIACYQSPAI